MKQIISPLLGATAALGVMLASCTGGSSPIIPAESDALLSGAITVVGVPLADLDNPSEVGEQDADKWSVRVIDPTESVDAIEIEHGDTTFAALALTPLDDYLLRIELLPAVDLSVGPADVTPVMLDLLVPVSAITDTVVTANIELVPPQDASAVHATAQAAGYRLIISYTITGEHPSTELIELDWNRQQLRRDTNSNSRLDDEVYFTDSDRNGIGDNRQQGLMGNRSHGALIQASGGVELVDGNLSRVTVSGQAFLIDETTVMVGYNDEIITLAELAAGQTVSVNGRKGKYGNVYATSIQVLAE